MHVHFGFLSPLLWIAVAFVAIQLRHRRKMEALRLRGRPDDYASSGSYSPAPFTSASSDARNNERRELEALRERVKVLERIATDGHTTDGRKTHDLAQEIEALRDR